ncbi:Similar to POL: Retrovirus-related Pol polyprotein from transposon 412 (Drosophila melanogaster) [Cotesia congregata]|uniref:Similar to POL: Retrovirus-related Pol polyprotein from transposon 412 (Drosophila melanogaster) n=1 Tax=Cotesia congregata TaxID=51543 RepID=A0A8J2HCC1_COTCN|nr:Similar to POL: Retrovirus-related Pol polyprotein from transposon 412 (Drosophila melanogaster) [Cotesia congregata]
MGHEAEIQNLTHHQNITNAIITTMGESMLLHQVLLRVPTFDGRNMPLKSFLEDVESAKEDSPEGLHPTLLKNIKSKLEGLARDAINGKEILTFNELKNALKEYFASKKSYPQYCADIQSVRLNQDESVLSYYNRIKNLVNNAVSSLKEKFNNEQEVTSMKKLLDGLALESFKRRLPDDLVYAVSVQNPANIEDAYKLAMRIEEDLKGSSARNSNYLRYAQTQDQSNNSERPTRVVSFQDEERRGTIPHSLNRNDVTYPRNNFNQEKDKEFSNQNSNNSNRYNRRRSPNRNYPSQYYPQMGYLPPFPYSPYVPPYYPPQMPYPAPYYQDSPYYPNTYRDRSKSPIPTNQRTESLNSQGARWSDAPTSEPLLSRQSSTINRKSIYWSGTSGRGPIVVLKAPELKNGQGRFLVDTGADINIVKLEALHPRSIIAAHEALTVSGITNDKVNTVGSTELTFFKKPQKFHVFRETLPIPTDGIIGVDFLEKEKVEISFHHNAIVADSRPISPIYFEPSKPNELVPANPPPVENIPSVENIPIWDDEPTTFIVKARTRACVNLKLKPTNLITGYLPRIRTEHEHIYMGENLVTNFDNTCNVFVINSYEEDMKIQIPPQEIFPFESDEFSEDFFNSDSNSESVDSGLRKHKPVPLPSSITAAVKARHAKQDANQNTKQDAKQDTSVPKQLPPDLGIQNPLVVWGNES